MLKKIIATFGLAALFTVTLMNPSLAQEAVENSLFWDYLMQDAASPSAERIHEFHNMLVYIITGITLFVLLLLIIVVLRFNKRANPTPSKTSHNVLLEVLWTALPVVILIIIAIPSFKLLYYVDRTENPEMTLKVTGYQWYWGYEYPEHGDINFMSYMVQDEDIDTEKGQLRLLSTDNPVVLPVNKNIQIDITAADVLHSWAVPALGVKKDAVPGRLNSTWFRITEPGTYYGQCSELCGKDHAYMPIEIKAVSQEEFEEWVLAQGGTLPEPSPAADNHSESTDSIENGDVPESNIEQTPEEADTESEGDE
ncbi:MAG: cytochrome c oxidase subunit II [Micavibrio sp.]|nr:cytochrome c oxidase subunit II [Micavibrio sp.]